MLSSVVPLLPGPGQSRPSDRRSPPTHSGQDLLVPEVPGAFLSLHEDATVHQKHTDRNGVMRDVYTHTHRENPVVREDHVTKPNPTAVDTNN